MDEITDISIGCETEEGISVLIEGTETLEFESGENIRQRASESIYFSRDELRQLVEEGQRILERDFVKVDGKTKLTEVERGEDAVTELYIESYKFPEDAEFRNTASILTDSYEIGTTTTGDVQLEQDLHHSIQDVDGSVFRINADHPVDVAYTCRLTNWTYDENGEVEDIEVPETPYDQGHVDLEPGDYRVWEETTGK